MIIFKKIPSRVSDSTTYSSEKQFEPVFVDEDPIASPEWSMVL
jgi:hypothetical protein